MQLVVQGISHNGLRMFPHQHKPLQESRQEGDQKCFSFLLRSPRRHNTWASLPVRCLSFLTNWHTCASRKLRNRFFSFLLPTNRKRHPGHSESMQIRTSGRSSGRTFSVQSSGAQFWRVQRPPEPWGYLVPLDKVLLEDVRLVDVANVAPECLVVLVLKPAKCI